MTGPWGYGGASSPRFWRCKIHSKFGWYCRRPVHFDGPCALVPTWWNVVEHVRSLRRDRRY